MHRKDTMSAKDYFIQGSAHYKLEHYELAIKAYSEAIKLKADDAKLYRHRGHAHYKLKHYDLACQDFDEVIKLNQIDTKIYYYRGICHYELNQYDLANRDFNQAIKLKPDYAQAYRNRGVISFKRKKYKLAILDFNEALRLKADYALAYNNRGLSHYELGQYSSAIVDYTKVIELSPDGSAYNNRAYVYFKLNKLAAAMSDYITALELDPDHKLAAIYLKKLLSGIKKTDDLHEVKKGLLLKAINILPNDACIEDKKRFLRKCLTNNHAFGQRMRKPENPLASIISFFGTDPNSYESIKCDESKGTLRQVCESLEFLDPSFVPPYKLSESEYELRQMNLT